MKRFLLFIGLMGLAYLLINNAHIWQNPAKLEAKLITVDTAQITRILVFPYGYETHETILNKTETGWIATQNVKNILVADALISQTLDYIDKAEIGKIATKTPKEWSKYRVGEENGHRVQIFEADKKILDILLGGPLPESTRPFFLRFFNGQEVYEIEPGLVLNLSRHLENYRNRTVFNIPNEDIEKMSLTTNDSLWTIAKAENGQFFNGDHLLDAKSIRAYLGKLNWSETNASNDFADSFDEVAAADNLLKTLNIYSANHPEPVKISLYYDSTAVKPFIIHSSLNKDTYFSSDSTGLYETFFQPWAAFLNEQN